MTKLSSNSCKNITLFITISNYNILNLFFKLLTVKIKVSINFDIRNIDSKCFQCPLHLKMITMILVHDL